IITSEECSQLINFAQNKLAPATIMGESQLEISSARSSETTWFQHDSDKLIHRICERIACIVNSPLNFAEDLQVARYQVLGKFSAHFDSFDNSTEIGRKSIMENGQRIVTALLYLNDVSFGGETFFPVLNIKVPPAAGSLLVFENCRKKSIERHLSSIHEGCLVTEGEKWIATLWFHEQKQY
ncbi:2OG-Fe(II) oxygenase, partial [Bacillus cereus]|nr:2OG-Fe(II) oxygenase [Bacillus cereus]